MLKKKIALIGSGNIGSTLALLCAQKNMGDIIMFDVFQGVARGKSLDLNQTLNFINNGTKIIGTSDYKDIADADVCLVTAGFPRKPGMSRDDLLLKNLEVIKSVAQGIKTYAPNAFVIIVTNPLDVMVYAFLKLSGFNANKVIGMAGVLDSARFKTFLSWELGISSNDIHAFVLGGHGDEMVPLKRFTTVGGISLVELISMGLLDEDKLDKIINRTRRGGGEIVNLLGNGSAYYAPAFSAITMANSFLNNEKRLLACACFLQGEYNVNGLFIGVPAIIGINGVEKILELKLLKDERQKFHQSILSVQNVVNTVDKLI